MLNLIKVLFLFKLSFLSLRSDECDENGKCSIIIDLFPIFWFLKGFFLFNVTWFEVWKLIKDFEGLQLFKELLKSFITEFLLELIAGKKLFLFNGVFIFFIIFHDKIYDLHLN